MTPRRLRGKLCPLGAATVAATTVAGGGVAVTLAMTGDDEPSKRPADPRRTEAIEGAVTAAMAEEIRRNFDPPPLALGDVNDDLFAVASWNNQHDRTQADVVALLDSTIRRLQLVR